MKITEKDVTFEISIKEETLEVRGNLICSGDYAFDRMYEDSILRRLGEGDESAWCMIVVTAIPKDVRLASYKGCEYLGACELKGGSGREIEQQAWELANMNAMKAQALESLNANLQDVLKEAELIRGILSER